MAIIGSELTQYMYQIYIGRTALQQVSMTNNNHFLEPVGARSENESEREKSDVTVG